MEGFGNIDSKYRFIILASKRAKQLLKGAKPKIKAKSRNLIRIAQTEVRSGLIDYEIIPAGKEDIPDRDERVFVGGDEIGEPEHPVAKDLVEEVAGKEAPDEVETEVEEEEEPEEELEDGLKEDKED